MHPLHHTSRLTTLTIQELPPLVPQVARLYTQVQTLHHEVMEIGGEAQNATMQIRCIHEEQEHHSRAILNQQAEQENISYHLHLLEEEVATMRQQVLAAEARANIAE